MNKKIIPLLFFAFSPNAFALDAIDLSSSISQSSSRIKPNENISYTATIANNSATTAVNSKILFYLPPRNVSIASLPSDCVAVGKSITCSIGDLTANATATRTISVFYTKTSGNNISALALSDNDDFDLSNNLNHVITTVSSKTLLIPSISTINVSPSSVLQGNSVTFSTTLSDNLPNGYSVKIDYGSGLVAMTGSGKNYSLTATPNASAAYSIGVYDILNVLKNNTQTGNFSVTVPNVAPTLNFVSSDASATSGTAYNAQLSATDTNLSLILMDWGDGTTDSKNAVSGTNVSFSHTYSSANSFTWKATAYDSQNATSTPVSKTIAISPIKADTKPTGTSGYTKISNSGAALPDSATLGSGSNDWACTKDNKTGFIWEVKTDDNGLRDKDWVYSWYEPDASKNGGFQGYKNYYPNYCKGSECDTYAFKNAVNNQSLCGATDWRLPTKTELEGLVSCSDGKTTTLGKDTGGSICTGSPIKPTINVTYFPNTLTDGFWSSSPFAGNSGYAWIVGFGNGNSDGYGLKGSGHYVRLVRG